MTDAQSAVSEFFDATNRGDSAALLATFQNSAILYNADEGTYAGITEIKRWDDKEYIGANCRVEVVKTTVTGKGQVIAEGDTRGDFPGNRITLYFLFTVTNDKIAELTMHS